MIETSSFARLRAYRMGLLVMVLGILVPVSLAGPADAKTLTVNSTQDFSDVYPGDGVCDTIAIQLLNPCALRGAMQEANSLAGMDVIYFDIPGGGARTIEPNSQLPVVTQQVTIDGYTQPGATENTLVGATTPCSGSSSTAAVLPARCCQTDF